MIKISAPPLALIVCVPPVLGQMVTPLALVEAEEDAELTNPVMVIASPDVAPELMFEATPATPRFARTSAWAFVVPVGLWLKPSSDIRPVALEIFAPALIHTPAELAWLLAWPLSKISPDVEVIFTLSVAIAPVVPSRTPLTELEVEVPLAYPVGVDSVAEVLPASVIAPVVETKFTQLPKTIEPLVFASASDQRVMAPSTVVNMFLIEVLAPCAIVIS